jgi:hypothetical protein
VQIEIEARGGKALFREYDRLLVDGTPKPAPEIAVGDIIAGLSRVLAVRELAARSEP